MMIAPFTGYHLGGNFGRVAQCPHCTRTDIAKVNKAQVTCGGLACREKQNKAAARLREARNKRKRATA